MAKYRLRETDVEATQYFKGVEIEGVIMSEGWKPSGHWSDRFHEDPEEKTPYIFNTNMVKLFLKEGDWVVNGPDGMMIYDDDEFNDLYKPIKK